MRSSFLVFVFLIISLTLSSQIIKGFNKNEARQMLALCNSFTQINLFNSDSNIVPKNYKKVYTSGVYGLDNKFQVWQSGQTSVIIFRGSTSEKSSWLENMYSVMIPAQGFIVLPGLDTIEYKFAENENACIHAGWSLGVAFMIEDILHEIDWLNSRGIFNIIISGHSQGGALAHLTRAYLENLGAKKISKLNQFKTYSFASPMVGNSSFASEYALKYINDSTSYHIVNPMDRIVQMPFTIEKNEEKIYFLDNFASILDSNSNESLWNFAKKSLTKVATKDPVQSYIQLAGYDVHEQIEKKLGPIKMPTYSTDLTYIPMSQHIEIGPFDEIEKQLELPKKRKGSTSEETISYRNDLEKLRGGSMYQHKPFNYYLYFLKEFFNEDYIEMIKTQTINWNRS